MNVFETFPNISCSTMYRVCRVHAQFAVFPRHITSISVYISLQQKFVKVKLEPKGPPLPPFVSHLPQARLQANQPAFAASSSSFYHAENCYWRAQQGL